MQFLVNGPLLKKSLTLPPWLFPKFVKKLDLVMRNTTEIVRFARALQSELFGLIKYSSNISNIALLGSIEITQDKEAPSRSISEEWQPIWSEEHATKRDKPLFSSRSNPGHKIAGRGIVVISWDWRATAERSAEIFPTEESEPYLAKFVDVAVADAVAYLNENGIDLRKNVSYICSQSLK